MLPGNDNVPVVPYDIVFWQSTVHDSVEDARTALALYKQYDAMTREGTFAAMLEDIYAEGRKSGWKINIRPL